MTAPVVKRSHRRYTAVCQRCGAPIRRSEPWPVLWEDRSRWATCFNGASDRAHRPAGA